jgi:hypothetical protein
MSARVLRDVPRRALLTSKPHGSSGAHIGRDVGEGELLRHCDIAELHEYGELIISVFN